MKRLVFDSGPIISLTTNNLLWLLEPLKERFGGVFSITEGVHQELVDRPLQTKKFKFEALQVEELIESGVIEVVPTAPLAPRAERLMYLANGSFSTQNELLRLVQRGEVETLAAATLGNAQAVVMDERITRNMIEKPYALADLLSDRLHTKVHTNVETLREFEQLVAKPVIIRSVELVTLAYEFGLLDRYKVRVPNVDKELIESVLWGMKLHGCSVSEQEIEQLVETVTGR
jgi:predicted nucleic acid-binding protein